MLTLALSGVPGLTPATSGEPVKIQNCKIRKIKNPNISSCTKDTKCN